MRENEFDILEHPLEIGKIYAVYFYCNLQQTAQQRKERRRK